MFLLKERLRQKYHTLNWPGEQPALSGRYRGKPVLVKTSCETCNACLDVCPTSALSRNSLAPRETPNLDMGRCIFCGACSAVCPNGAISFSQDYNLAARDRSNLLISPGMTQAPLSRLKSRGIFRRSFKLRQVSAGGCGACEADCNVLGTLVYDLGRFGVEFAASPRHADAIVLTGPISRNMHAAFLDAWQSVPEPRLLIAVGSCAISGGMFQSADGCLGGMDGLEKQNQFQAGTESPDHNLKVDIYIPGCPPNPWSILAGLLLARQ